MSLDLGRILRRSLSISWRHKWLWLLGVFGGGEGASGLFFGFPTGGAGGRGRGLDCHGAVCSSVIVISPDQVGAWLGAWAWLIATLVAAGLVIVVIGFVLGCFAVPAAIWAGLAIDADQPSGLGPAWSEGTRRFWVYFRLYLLRLLITLALLVAVGILVGIGAIAYNALGAGSLLALIPLGLLLVLVVFVASLAISFLLVWSERLVVILGVGAVEALRRSAWLARRAWVDTLVFALVMGIVVGAIGLAAGLAGAIGAVPGTIVLVLGVSANSTLLASIGVVLAVVIGGGIFLAGAGFAGSVIQVAFALACRDLCQRWGLPLASPAPRAAPVPTRVPASPPVGA